MLGSVLPVAVLPVPLQVLGVPSRKHTTPWVHISAPGDWYVCGLGARASPEYGCAGETFLDTYLYPTPQPAPASVEGYLKN